MTSNDSNRGRGAVPLTLGLGAACPVAYFLIWILVAGDTCGPAGNTTSGDVLAATPFVLPLLATGIAVVVGTTLNWRRRSLLIALVTTLVVAAAGEVVVLLLQIVAHHCTE